jgi:hypothetical protein
MEAQAASARHLRERSGLLLVTSHRSDAADLDTQCRRTDQEISPD